MGRFYRAVTRRASGVNPVSYLLLPLLAAAALFSGCIAKVQIPAADQFHVIAGLQEGNIDTSLHEKILLDDLYTLMQANEGVEVPICTAAKDSKECIKNGVSFFVLGGVIPGLGHRTVYVFSEIALDDRQLVFMKDNSHTTFIGTSVWTRANKCEARAAKGGLRVEMTKYFANWAGIGNMYMAEEWAIDYMDLNRGILGLQLALDIKGYLTTGGGSRYILLKFPNVPEALSQSTEQFSFVDRK